MDVFITIFLSNFYVSMSCAQDLDFPPGFKFGAASSAYQVEGAWNVSDKSMNIWDHFTHYSPDKINGGVTGDVACDSYHLWKRDIEMLEELGVHFYRLSISWARLLPTGFPDRISDAGQKYYSDLIDGLLEKGIEPVVTLYHWDLPLRLHKLGGWINPLISDWFADYARVVFSLYGDRVTTWITINEPLIMCDMAYNSGTIAPGYKETDVAPHICTKQALLAHAKAYRIYEKEFRDKQNGRVSLTSLLEWYEPYTKNDTHLAELVTLYVARTYHAVYSREGGWPAEIEKIFAEKSRKKGYTRPILPPFEPEEIELVRGTYDFYALNHYTSRMIRPAVPGETFGIWPVYDCQDLDVKFEYDPTWKKGSGNWFYVNPVGLRKQLAWLKKNYGDFEIMIMENGYPSEPGLNDQDRIEYYKDVLKQILLSIKEDGVNVTGYTAWTLMDSFEWMDGFNTKFGLYEVDFSSANKTRTPRASALFFKNVIAKHSVDVPDVFINITDATNGEGKQMNTTERNIIIVVLVVVAGVVCAVAACAVRMRRRRDAERAQKVYSTVNTVAD